MSVEPVPYFKPELSQAEIDEVVATLESTWLTTGPKTKQFEKDFAETVGAKHAIALNSCTAALTLALEALGVGRDDEVIVPTMTFASTAEVVVHLGGRPVLIDIEPGTLCMDPAKIEAAITPRTKAITAVHYGGQPCDMDEIHAVAEKNNLPVVEDAAHALPAKYKGRTIGSVSELSCFSFYANKTMTTGEGGMLVTDNDKHAARARIMSLHGMNRDAWKRFTSAGSWFYELVGPGYKFNMTDLAASLGLHQLKRVHEFRDRRAQVVAWYEEALADIKEIERPTVKSDRESAWHLYQIQINLDRLSIDRAAFIENMKEAKIGASVHWMPLHMHPYYAETFSYKPEDLPVAKAAYERLVSLPLFPSMTREQVERVGEVLRDIVAENKKS